MNYNSSTHLILTGYRFSKIDSCFFSTKYINLRNHPRKEIVKENWEVTASVVSK